MMATLGQEEIVHVVMVTDPTKSNAATSTASRLNTVMPCIPSAMPCLAPAVEGDELASEARQGLLGEGQTEQATVQVQESQGNAAEESVRALSLSAAITVSSPPQTHAPAVHVPPPAAASVQDEDEVLDPFLTHISILSHLAVFAVLGVLIRGGLEILFGPDVAHVTDDWQTTFVDLPANIFGTFIMGIVGLSLKRDIAHYSEHLAIGLSTGLCGSITTFASWNQRMLAIAASGLWARAICGYITGAGLAVIALLVGMDAAEFIKGLLEKINARRERRDLPPITPATPETFNRRWASLLLFASLAITLWTLSGVGVAFDTFSDHRRKLWFACLIGPFGCWVRWYLSWMNGKVLRKGLERWKWVPFGTISTNVGASVLEAAVSILYLQFNSESLGWVAGGVQLGFLGCMSTVSTLMVETVSLHKAKAMTWRAYTYLFLLTILPSFVLGICVYAVPLWVLGLESSYNRVT